MDSDIEKNDSMIEQLEKYNLVYIRVPAVNGVNIVQDRVDTIDGIKYILSKKMIKKARGCLMSHFKCYHMIYNDMIENKYKNAVIFEDDVSFELVDIWRRVINIRKIIKKAPKDWDVIKMNSSNITVTKTAFTNRITNYTDNEFLNQYVFRDCNSSTLAYIINRKGIKKLFKHFYKDNVLYVDDVIDTLIWRVCKTYHYKYPLFVSLEKFEKNKAGIKSNEYIKKDIYHMK